MCQVIVLLVDAQVPCSALDPPSDSRAKHVLGRGPNTILKKHGAALAVTKFRLQLDSYWREKAPFDRAKPVQDGDVLGWWRQFLDDPEADVLAVRHSRSLYLVVD